MMPDWLPISFDWYWDSILKDKHKLVHNPYKSVQQYGIGVEGAQGEQLQRLHTYGTKLYKGKVFAHSAVGEPWIHLAGAWAENGVNYESGEAAARSAVMACERLLSCKISLDENSSTWYFGTGVGDPPKFSCTSCSSLS